MTSDVIDAPDSAAHPSLDAAHQHITLLRRKQEQLRASQIEAEGQYLYRVGQLYADGELSEPDLAFVYRAYTAIALTGYMKRWDAAISIPAARMQYLLRHLATLDRHAPNLPDGTWAGTWPLGIGDRAPAYDICVVYVLYDVMNVPCYVGSSQNLSGRLKWHRKDGKPFVRWTASRCADREAAYHLEEKLLSEHQSYLNKKRYR